MISGERTEESKRKMRLKGSIGKKIPLAIGRLLVFFFLLSNLRHPPSTRKGMISCQSNGHVVPNT